jgi:hypothetical protein
MDSKLYPQGRGGVKTREVGNTLQFLDVNGAVIFTVNADLGTVGPLGGLYVARATFDPSGDATQRTVAAHTLGITIPSGAIVVGGFIDVITTFADGASDNATIAIKVEGANDVVTAVAISDGANPWDAGKHAIIPKANTPESTGVKTTADRLVTATVAVHALTAGKAYIFLYYVQSSAT